MILIKQNGRNCELWQDGICIEINGRCKIKREAKKLHEITGDKVFNIKNNGTQVEVSYSK